MGVKLCVFWGVVRVRVRDGGVVSIRGEMGRF